MYLNLNNEFSRKKPNTTNFLSMLMGMATEDNLEFSNPVPCEKSPSISTSEFVQQVSCVLADVFEATVREENHVLILDFSGAETFKIRISKE